MKRRYIGYLLRMLVSTSVTRWASIFFTRSCTRSCPYCQAPFQGQGADLGVEEWFRVVDRLQSWGVLAVNLVGGEPTLRPELPSFVKYIASKGMLPLVTTNGDLLTTEYVDTLAASGLGILQVSLDSLKGFAKSSPHVLELLPYVARRGIVPVVCSTATSVNVEEIPYLAHMSAKKCVMFNCSFYQGVGGALSAREPGLALSRRQAERLIGQLRQFKSETGLLANHNAYLDNLVRHSYERLWKCDPKKDFWITVNNDGTLMRCQEYPSHIAVLDLESLSDERWIEHKREKVAECPGCYWQPYYEKQESSCHRLSLIKESRTLYAIARLLSKPRDITEPSYQVAR